jgi:hypothetical protein
MYQTLVIQSVTHQITSTEWEAELHMKEFIHRCTTESVDRNLQLISQFIL